MGFFLGGPILGLLAGFLSRGQENQRTSSALSEYVAERAAVLKRETFAITEALYHTRAFLSSTQAVTRGGFRDFTRDIVARHPVIGAVEWFPHVTHKEREAHERKARAEGLAGYRISARDPSGALAPVRPKPDYFPMYFREPTDPGRRILGLDLSLDKGRAAVLALAAQKDEIALTDPINLSQDSKAYRGFLALLPLYDQTPGARPLRGMVGILIRARELFLHALENAAGDTAPDVYLELVDVDVNGKPGVIASFPDGAGKMRFLDQTASVSMDLGEQRWRLSARPSQAFIDRHRTARPITLGLGVFFFWELLGGITLVLTKRSHDLALRRQSLVYESAVRSLSEGVIVADKDGRFLLFNRSAREILGVGMQDVPVSGWSNAYGCFLPDTVTPFPPERLPLARALKGERATEEIFIRNPHVPGGVWISSSGAPITNEDGVFIGGVVNIRDISEWKSASESLRLSVKELKDLKYGVDQASIVAITSLEGKILYVNDNFQKISGYSESELLGNNHRLLNSSYHPPAFIEELWRKIGSGGVWRGVFRNKAQDGGLYWVDTTIVPLLDDAGLCERYLAISTDVTASKLQEQDLLLLSSAVEQTADAVFITNSAGVISYVNPAFESVTEFSRVDAVGKTPRILKSGTNDPRYYEELWRTILRGESFRSLSINRKKGGGLFEAEQTITPIKDSAGNIANFVSVVKDITDRVMRQRQEIEMRYAAQVQRQLYPAQAMDIRGYDIAGMSYSAEFACGDYYDYLESRNGLLWLALGDVSGHGLAPAMIMTATRSYLRFLLRSQSDLGEIMNSVNEVLYADLERNRFVALLLAGIDPATRRLMYVNAGLTSGFVLDETGLVKAELSNCGPPLGLVPDAAYNCREQVQLEPGDVVVLMTDGIVEARNRLDQFFENAGALAVVRAHLHDSAKQIVESLYEEVRGYSQGAPQADDITAIVCKVH